jgi:molecular chaperone DnaK (HSP70)
MGVRGTVVANSTISIGIDLGTTNSSVAINNQETIEVVKKPGGVEYTPSVFGFDKAKNKVVGQRAYDSLFLEFGETGAQNYKPEVKRIIGTPETFYFDRGGIAMTAEEISAEILKSLKQDILRKYPHFDTTAAVIAIPAAFSVLQCEATKRAGNLAGFKHVVLLQEPIAAGVAYGFAKGKDENWLVYDLGGGTFDVALISSKDGILSVLAHNGDNFLGGKNIDWDIVDKIITPQLLDKFSLRDFRRDNKSNSNKFGRLKYLAEKAKIELSQYENTTLDIDGIGKDDSSTPIAFSMNISRKQIEALIRPLVDRTIDLCRDTLGEAGLDSSSVSKVVLVGGPTQMPYISERLESDLGIAADTSVDPLTVVARGACIFALSQRVPKEFLPGKGRQKKDGARTISLNHVSLGAELQQAVTGVIEGLEASSDYYLLIQSDGGSFASPKVPLRNGKFFTNVTLEPNKPNLFWIYLFDSSDSDVPIDPESFTITHGLSIAGPPIPHSIGVVVSKKDPRDRLGNSEVFERLIEKGSILPAKRTEPFKTVRDLKRNESANPLWIRVGEGESDSRKRR